MDNQVKHLNDNTILSEGEAGSSKNEKTDNEGEAAPSKFCII